MNDSKPIFTLLNNINSNISTTCIRYRQPILIAVSGGQDSICLFFIFIQLKKQWKWAFGIVYCNHLWQKNSLYTGSLIIKISYIFNISIYYVTNSNKAFNEESSRNWRYKTFYRISFLFTYTTVITGHTLSDKLETSLFQFIRGSSPENLVSLNNIKYFSSNKKFTKNYQIKHLYFFTIKNYNILIKSFPVRFAHIKKKTLPGFFAIKFFLNKVSGETSLYDEFSGEAYRKKKLYQITKLQTFFQPVQLGASFPRLRKTSYQIQSRNIFLSENLPSFQEKLSLKLCPVFHKNYQVVIQAKNIKINIKTLQTSTNLKAISDKIQDKTQRLWIFGKKTTAIRFSKLLHQSVKNQPTINLQTKNNVNVRVTESGAESTKLIVIRPILLLHRFDLKKLLLFFILPIYPDLTNQDKIYQRNRIRKELLPALKFFFNPKIQVNFAHFSEILYSEQFYFNLVFQRLKKQLYTFTKNNFILNTSFFYNIPIAFRRKLIKQVLVDCTKKNIRFINIEKFLDLLYKPQISINCYQTVFSSNEIFRLKNLKSGSAQLSRISQATDFTTNSCIEDTLRSEDKNSFYYVNLELAFNVKICDRHVLKLIKSNQFTLLLNSAFTGQINLNSGTQLQINQRQSTNKNIYFSDNIYYQLLKNRIDLKHTLFDKKSNFDKIKNSLIRKNFFIFMYFVPSYTFFNKITDKAACEISFDNFSAQSIQVSNTNSNKSQTQKLTTKLTTQEKKKIYKISTVCKYSNRKNQFNFEKLVQKINVL